MKNMALSDCHNLYIINAIPPFSDLSIEFSMKLHTIKSKWSILYIKESHVIILKKMYFEFISANSADPYEMLHNAAFHLGLHCLQMYSCSGFQSTKGY